MLGFEFKNGKIIKRLKVKNEDFKKIMLDLKSVYKYKNVFIKDNYNSSFAILILENFLVVIQYVLNNFNNNIGFETKVLFDEREDTYNIYLEINKFYDMDLSSLSEEEYKSCIEKMGEIEKDVLEDFLMKLPTQENLGEKISTYCDRTNNMDESIKAYKENNAEIKKSKFDFYILHGLFDVYALNVLKDMVTKEYLEEGELN